MSVHETPHPDAEQLNNYLTGRLSGDESRFVGAHLDDCAECCQQIETLGIPCAIMADENDVPDQLAGASVTEYMDARPEPPDDSLGHMEPPSVRYEAFEQFAEGGMSVIYRAHDLHLDRDVAIKVLSEGRHQQTRLRRFRSEASVLGQLQHPGIPPVFDQGRLPDGRAFIAMKLIEGKTLAELLEARESRRTDHMQFLGVFKQVCETVAFAHARGVIHRDLKPENVMVGEFGEVQVMDWGLAKRLMTPSFQLAGSSPEEFVSPEDTATLPTGPARTMAGAVIGTPAYMPPEQAGASSELIDERADVFSLGAILCEVLTGQPPYVGVNSTETFEQARSAALDGARERLTGCGADSRLIDLALRCLAPELIDRIESAREITVELESGFESIQERLREIELAQSRQEELRRRRRLQTMLVVVVCLFVTLFTGGWAFVARQNEVRHRQDLEQVSTALGEATQLREQALKQPLDSVAIWSAAREAVRRADAVDGNSAVLDARVRELSSQIDDEAEAARRDRELIAALTDAHAPVTIPDLPFQSIDPHRRSAGPSGGRRHGPPPPHHHFGGPHDHRPPPHGHPGPGDRRGPDPEQIQKMQTVHAGLMTARFTEALAASHLDPEHVTADQAAQRINTRPELVRTRITDALDSWLAMLCHPLTQQRPHREWVLAVLGGIDPDRQRTSIRALAGAGDITALREVAQDEALVSQSPAFIWLVASQLDSFKDTIDLLREARARHPGSLLINQQLGEQLVRDRHGVEAIDAYMAALAIRPNASMNVCAALLLTDHGRYDEALAMYRNAIRLDPHCTPAYVRLAHVLTGLGRADEAVTVAEDALDVFGLEHPDAWQFHLALGKAREQLQDLEAALKAYRRALSLDGMTDEQRTNAQERLRELDSEVRE